MDRVAREVIADEGLDVGGLRRDADKTEKDDEKRAEPEAHETDLAWAGESSINNYGLIRQTVNSGPTAAQHNELCGRRRHPYDEGACDANLEWAPAKRPPPGGANAEFSRALAGPYIRGGDR